MNLKSPEASLVVSVYDNLDYLKVVLDSLSFQTFRNFEVIISEDAQHSIIREFIEGYSSAFPIFHLSQPDEGWQKNKALNKAAVFAHSEYLIFIDGDCVLHPRFIEFHLKLAHRKRIVAGKRIKLNPESTEWLMLNPKNVLHFQNYIFRNYRRMHRNGTLFMEEGFFFNPNGFLGIIPRIRTMKYLKGCNMSFYKETLLAINGFDEDYVRPAVGEDADMEWRFRRAGYRIKSARNLAVQYHLYHKESWTNQDENLAMMLARQKADLYVCKNGIQKLDKGKSRGKLPNLAVSQTSNAPSSERTISPRIGFDAKRAFYNHSGLGNYSRNLINALTKCFPDGSYTLFTPGIKGRINLLREEQLKMVSPKNSWSKIFPSIWRTRSVVKSIKHERIDVYHGLSQELPIGIKMSGAKAVVTVHDLIFFRFPHFFSPIDAYIYRKKLVYACRVADKVVAISSQTKRDLIEFLDLDPAKIVVIYQGCSVNYWKEYEPSEHEAIQGKYNLPEKYLLYVGTIEERKNLLSVIKAVQESEINIPLVAVGRKANYYYNTVVPYINEHKVKNVYFLEGILDEELPIIYQNAECFIYPSLFEGFGIPLLEALVSGIPVITSNGGCFAEAAGPGSIYVEPTNHLEIAEAIRKVSENPELRKKMIAEGKEYSKRFTQEFMVNAYMDMYNSLVNSKQIQ